MKTRLVLAGGGIGSAALLFSQAGRWSSYKRGQHFRDDRPLQAISFDYGQANARRQLKAAEAMTGILEIPWKTVKIPKLVGARLPGELVPGLYMTFSALACNLLEQEGGGEAIFGFVEDDQDKVPECRPSFLGPLSKALELAGIEAEISVPHIASRKSELLSLFWEHSSFHEVVRASYSCSFGKKFPCGRCPSCRQRRQAFREANIIDPDLEA